ncbi:MAG: FKBP-type peptidyl-prolyl cis-trans isomerase, partial [Thermodesulfobacteriota bacterium]
SGDLVKGLENALIGMESGQDKEFEVPAAEGYGEVNIDLIQNVDLELLKQNEIEPEVGMVIQTSHGNCHVTNIDGNDVEISYNHPLAGNNLSYSVKIVNVKKK